MPTRYAGRTELPDSIKSLFRPVTMIRPDLLQICEIWLFSEGFEGARVLAKKMTTLYSLGEGQLSKQYVALVVVVVVVVATMMTRHWLRDAAACC